MVDSGDVIAPFQRDEIWRWSAHAPRWHQILRPLLTSSAGFVGRRLRGHAGLPVNHPVELGVAQDDLHVFAGFGERDGLDEFGNLFVITLAFPGGNSVFAGVVSGSG